jgi:hypothetical protein
MRRGRAYTAGMRPWMLAAALGLLAAGCVDQTTQSSTRETQTRIPRDNATVDDLGPTPTNMPGAGKGSQPAKYK